MVIAADGRTRAPRARFDAEVGWWLMAIGVAMAAAQMAIFIAS